MFNTDKVGHGYLPTYQEIAASIGAAGRVCELGVFDGGSLEMWQSYFPDGIVAGVDYNPEATWPDGTVKLLASQTSVALPNQLWDLSPEGWDLIVDDCSHIGKLTKQSWEMLWPVVKPGGWYVIEDWYVGMPPWTTMTPHGDPEMLKTAESFLQLLAWDGRAPVGPNGVETVTYKRGLIVMRKGR